LRATPYCRASSSSPGSFDPAGLVEHLDQRFELLSGGARTALPRHRTLRAAIDWSYDLLDLDERALFGRIGVFPADFDYAAVRAICGTGGPVDRDVLALLPGLVDKSLVFVVGGGTRRRYRLLETIRAYAAERLTESGAEADVRGQHAAYYLALAERANAGLRTPGQRAWIDLLMLEQPNLRAGLAHSVAVGDINSAWQWVDILGRFWDINGQRREGDEWIQRALEIGDPPSRRGC
jgi:predicted ATPase